MMLVFLTFLVFADLIIRFLVDASLMILTNSANHTFLIANIVDNFGWLLNSEYISDPVFPVLPERLLCKLFIISSSTSSYSSKLYSCSASRTHLWFGFGQILTRTCLVYAYFPHFLHFITNDYSVPGVSVKSKQYNLLRWDLKPYLSRPNILFHQVDTQQVLNNQKRTIM